MKRAVNIWNEGTTQVQRKSIALQPEYFNVDERQFDDMVKSVVDHAATIPFFFNSHTPDSNWAELIKADEIVVLAQLRLLNIREIENHFYLDYHQFQPQLKTSANNNFLENALQTANQLHSRLENWLSILRIIPSDQQHYSIYQEWQMALSEIRDLKKPIMVSADQLVAHYEEVDTFFKTLIKTAFFLNSQYDRFLALSKGHQSHQPQNALIFSFIELFKHAQNAINTFHKRHLDFYYQEQLNLAPKTATPDSTFLNFQLAEAAAPTVVPAKTQMIAGQDDDGNDLIYETSEDLRVDNSSIVSLKGVYVNREKITSKDIEHVTHIVNVEHDVNNFDQPWSVLNIDQQKRTDIAGHAEIGFSLSSPNLKLLEGKRKVSLVFHGDIRYYVISPLFKQVFNNPKDAKLSKVVEKLKMKSKSTLFSSFFDNVFTLTNKPTGFCLNEDFVLKLLSINSGEYSQRNLENFIKNHGDLSITEFIDFLSKTSKIPFDRSLWQTIMDLTGETENEVVNKKFHRIFKTALHIKCSTESSWFDVDPISIQFTQKKDKSYSLEIIIVIDQSLPPLTTNKESFYKSPTIKFTLNPSSTLYGYDLFERLCIDKINCEIQVEGVKTLSLYNQLSQLDPNGPFIPFGPQPNTSSYLLIGNKEIFQKDFSKLTLNIDWMDLPNLSGGLKEHYKDYEFDLSNDIFKVGISLLDQGGWYPKEESREKVSLFVGKHKVQNSTAIRISTKLLNPKPDYTWDPEALAYNSHSQRGFLRLQLTDPQWGFGHAAYPNLVSQTAMRNARKANSLLASFTNKKFSMDLPPPPYTPKIDKLTIDYEVKFDFGLGNKNNKDHQFHHLYPFGGYIEDPSTSIGFSLIPSFRHEGILYIGIKNFHPPAPITILFEMNEKKALRDTSSSNRVHWDYLHNNNWVRFKPYEITKDSTENLLKTGIVKLEVTGKRSTRNTILNGDLFWLRVTALSGTDILGDVTNIALNATTAIYTPQKESQPDNFSIAPQTITGANIELSDIAGITQPSKSFGGKPTEGYEEFKTRVSERLRHKNRCVSQYDYERLILQNFPEINKVLCINAYNHLTDKKESGKVLVVVVPKIDTNDPDIIKPRVSISMLKAIKTLLKSKISPFIDLSIINPEYEHMRVFANVKLSSKYDLGQSSKLLNQEIREFISPWIKNPNAEPMFQRNITLEEIQSFIQSRPYVDFVTKVSATKVYKELETELMQGPYQLSDTGLNLEMDNETSGRYLWSIITTANIHQVTLVNNEDFELPDHAGLEELYLDEDFVIRKENES